MCLRIEKCCFRSHQPLLSGVPVSRAVSLFSFAIRPLSLAPFFALSFFVHGPRSAIFLCQIKFLSACHLREFERGIPIRTASIFHPFAPRFSSRSGEIRANSISGAVVPVDQNGSRVFPPGSLGGLPVPERGRRSRYHRALKHPRQPSRRAPSVRAVLCDSEQFGKLFARRKGRRKERVSEREDRNERETRRKETSRA